MTSSKRNYKVFVSSTFKDLKDHRAHVIQSLRNAGLFVDPMENWTADSDEPKMFSQDRLADCDLCVLLVAFRRGFVPEGETLSITQMEYEAALRQGVEVLVYQLDDHAKWWANYDEREKDPGLKEWRSNLGKRHGAEFFTDDPCSINMTGALGRWFLKKGVPSEGTTTLRIDWPADKSPYRGLQWFNQEYAPLFFGRDREVDELVAKMSEPRGRVLLVIGASGSGKSSVVAAGIRQAVTKQGRLAGNTQWVWQRIQPSDGDTPSDALARGLKGAFQLSARPRVTTTGPTLRDLLSQHLSQGQELILFVDQFEELFTSGFKETDIQTFLELLLGTAQDQTNRLRVIATIRSEFLGKLEAYESTLNLLNSPYRYHMGLVSPRMLQDMIEKPAEATGYTFERGLVERILQDTGQESGNLALVEYALKQLFEKQKGRVFTVEAYETIGGVVGAIATKANAVLSDLEEEVRGAFDAVFAELVHLERERPPTRRRAAVSRFSSKQAALQLIDALTGQESRVLVTSGSGQEAIVEVAHEKLFSAWPKLKDWIDKSGEALRDIEHAEEEARMWQQGGENPQELWLGSRAKKVLAAIEQFSKHLSPGLRRFLSPQQVLITRLNEDALSHQKRLLIGQKLAEFDDTRPGVGVKDDLPKIEWIDIPGGQIKLVGHVFEVKPFKMAKYLVTNAQFESFVNAEDGYRNDEWWNAIRKESDRPDTASWLESNAPRETLSWYEAVAFCRWLTHKLSDETRSTIRLPTEWEWQQAATGGDPTLEYPWGEWDAARCNGDESRLSRTTAVGMYPRGATPLGVMDMAGNLWELCLNTYENPAAPESRDINDTAGRRVLRGGSWIDVPKNLRVSYRGRYYEGNRHDYIGFRLAQDLP